MQDRWSNSWEGGEREPFFVLEAELYTRWETEDVLKIS